MAKTIDGSISVLQAVFTGNVTRVAKLVKPHRMEFTVDVSTTKLGTELFTIGTKVTFEVENTFLSSGRILDALTNLALGDRVEVTLEKQDDKWRIIGLTNSADRGRPAGDFLNDLEEELRRRA